MVRPILLATGAVLGFLESTQAQFSSTIDKDSVNLLLLSSATGSATATITGAVLDVSVTKTVYYVNCIGSLEKDANDDFVDPCPLIGGSVTQEASRWEYDIDKKTEEIRGTGLGTFTADISRTTYVPSLMLFIGDILKGCGADFAGDAERARLFAMSPRIRHRVRDISRAIILHGTARLLARRLSVA